MHAHTLRPAAAVYDPEGALGWISASWMTFLGLQAGRVFVNNKSLLANALSGGDHVRAVAAHVQRWVLWGLLLGALGGGLAGFSKEEGLIPINKVGGQAGRGAPPSV